MKKRKESEFDTGAGDLEGVYLPPRVGSALHSPRSVIIFDTFALNRHSGMPERNEKHDEY